MDYSISHVCSMCFSCSCYDYCLERDCFVYCIDSTGLPGKCNLFPCDNLCYQPMREGVEKMKEDNKEKTEVFENE